MTWGPLPRDGLGGNDHLDMLKRLRAMEAEIYGAIFAEEGIISGNLSVSGDLSFTGDMTLTGTLDVSGNVTFNGQVVTFTDPSFARIAIDMGADVSGFIAGYSGPYEIQIQTPYDSTGDTDSRAALSLRTSDASSDASWRLDAYEVGSTSTTLVGFADGGADNFPHIAGTIDQVGVFRWESNGLHFLNSAGVNGIYFDDSAGADNVGIQADDSGGASRWVFRLDLSASPPYAAVSNRASNGEVRIYANTSTAGAGGEQLIATFTDTDVELEKPLYVQGGTAGAPDIARADNTDVGIFLHTDGIGISNNSSEIGRFDASVGFQSILIYNVSSGGTPFTVQVDSTGQVFRSTSSQRYKKNIMPIDPEWVQLSPVQYVRRDDPVEELRWGFIAEDLANQSPMLAKYVDGQVEDFDDRAVLAVLAAKVNYLEERVRELEDQL